MCVCVCVCVCLISEDTAHSERYMGMATPADNLEGYEASAVCRFLVFRIRINQTPVTFRLLHFKEKTKIDGD